MVDPSDPPTSDVILAAIRTVAADRVDEVLTHPTDAEVLAVLDMAERLLRAGWFMEEETSTYWWNGDSLRIHLDLEGDE